MRLLKRTLPLYAAAALLGLVIGCSDPQAKESAVGATHQDAATSSPVMQPGEVALSDMMQGECKFPQDWIGQKVDRSAVQAAAKAFRILHPNDPATMDYRPDRLNVIINDNDIVTEVKCG